MTLANLSSAQVLKSFPGTFLELRESFGNRYICRSFSGKVTDFIRVTKPEQETVEHFNRVADFLHQVFGRRLSLHEAQERLFDLPDDYHDPFGPDMALVTTRKGTKFIKLEKKTS